MNQEQAKLKQELNRLRRQKSVLWLGILFFVAVLVWTAFAIFSSQKKVKLDSQLTALAKPLVPRLAAEVFAEIELRRDLSAEELSSFPIYVYYQAGEKGLPTLTDIISLETEADQTIEINQPVEAVPVEEVLTQENASSAADLEMGQN